jgi:hypothetical protein
MAPTMRIAVIGMSNHVNEEEVGRWVREAYPGQSIQYFQGFLALGMDAHGRPLLEAERQATARVASRLWRAAQHDLVHLVQRRQGPNNWSYIAVARRLPVVRSRNGNAPNMELHDG